MTDDRHVKDPVPVTGLIDRVLGRLSSADVAPVVRLRIDWDQIAGPWSTRCRPIALRDGVLDRGGGRPVWRRPGSATTSPGWPSGPTRRSGTVWRSPGSPSGSPRPPSRPRTLPSTRFLLPPRGRSGCSRGRGRHRGRGGGMPRPGCERERRPRTSPESAPARTRYPGLSCPRGPIERSGMGSRCTGLPALSSNMMGTNPAPSGVAKRHEESCG